MRIVDVRQIVRPIDAPISNAYISFAEMTVSVVALVTDVLREGHPVIGYGFNSNGRYAQRGLLQERFVPRLLGGGDRVWDAERENLSPERVHEVLLTNEKPGGHGDRAVAVGILDMAVWDAVAKIEGRPLYQVLWDRAGNDTSLPDRVWVYAAGGYYYEGKDLDGLRHEIRDYLDRGYTTVKIKIGGATLREDLQRVEAVLELLPAGGSLAVDANGRFDVRAALRYAEALAPYGLHWYEEPCDPLDYAGHAEVAAAYPGALATGENLLSLPDVRNLLRYGGLRPDRDVLQMDPALSYGLVEYGRMLDAGAEAGWGRDRFVPHGGHQLNLNLAAGLGLAGVEDYPDVFEPFGGFADGLDVDGGWVGLPDAPGIGLEAKSNLRPVLEELAG